MTDLRAQLTKDHLDLDALLQCLADDATAPESGALQVTWSTFEKRLLAHIDAEERYLLPLVETSHPSEAARTRTEHARILDVVSGLGVAVELHTARQPAIAELITMLRSHAEHEDRVLYPLASALAPASVQDQIANAWRTAGRFAAAAVVRYKDDRRTSNQAGLQKP